MLLSIFTLYRRITLWEKLKMGTDVQSALQKAEEEAGVLQQDYGKCLFSEWKLCTAGILLGMPFSIHRKSYWPFVIGGVIGTGLDFSQAKTVHCRELEYAIKEKEKLIANLKKTVT